MLNDAWRGVVRLCHAGLDTVTLRKELPARIEQVVPFEAYAFSTTDPDTGLLTHTVASGVPDSMMLAYCTHFYPFEAATITMDSVWRDHPIFSLWREVPDLETAMRSTGLRYDVHVALADRTGLWGDLCLMRERRASTAQLQIKFLQKILPHVTHALKNAVLIDSAHQFSDASRSEPMTPCVLALDNACRIVLRAGPVDEILEDLADIGVRAPDRLPGSIINAASRVRQLRSDRDGNAPEVLLRVRGNSGRWYTVRAMLAEPDAAGLSAAVVVIRTIGPREKGVLLTRLYGLSIREREVAAALARGESTKLIAARLRISPHTVKEHLDRACSKIGVRGRKALVARLFLDAQAGH